MLPTKDVSVEKIRRKLSADGFVETLRAGAELAGRKAVMLPAFRGLVDAGRVPLVEEFELLGTERPTVYPDGPGADATFATSVSDAFVFSSTGLSMTARGDVIGPTVCEPGARAHKTAAALSRHVALDGPCLVAFLLCRRHGALADRAVEVGTVVPIVPRYRNYYHWTIECLPRIRAIRAFETETGQAVTPLVPASPPNWMVASLRAVGYEADDLLVADASVYRASNLVVTSFPEPTRADARWLRETVLGNAEDASTTATRNVYVSRRDARERLVRNEETVENVLDEYDFRSYTLSDLSVTEQAELFHGADVVVGAHGAGLSNLVYAEDAVVVELFGEKVKSNYENLATTVGLRYESLQCEARGVDLVVDPDRLRRTLERVLA